LTDKLAAAFPGLPNARWVALRLLDGDERMAQALRSGELLDLSAPQAAVGESQPVMQLAAQVGAGLPA
jgi:ferrous iron transport protein B